MRKGLKKVIAIVATAAMTMSIGMPAFANVPIEKNADDYTLGEIQGWVVEYFAKEEIPMQLGTDAYYEYVVDQLISGTDEKLKQHPQYDLIHAYMTEYKLECDKAYMMAEEMPAVAKMSAETNVTFHGNKEFLGQTIGEIKEEVKEQNDVAMPLATNAVYSYNGTAAANYALRYAVVANDDYPYYAKGDCTNFVSQCLVAGGMSMTGTPSDYGVTSSTTLWHCKPFYLSDGYVTFGATTAWTLVTDFKTYMERIGADTTEYSSIASVAQNCAVGDIVQLTDKTTGKPHHSIIISSKYSNDFGYCGHTRARENDKASEYIDMTSNNLLLYKE